MVQLIASILAEHAAIPLPEQKCGKEPLLVIKNRPVAKPGPTWAASVYQVGVKRTGK